MPRTSGASSSQPARTRSGSLTRAATKPPARHSDPLDLIRQFRAGAIPNTIPTHDIADTLQAALSTDRFYRLVDNMNRLRDKEKQQNRIEAGVKRKARAK
jgi:hypothetical protein